MICVKFLEKMNLENSIKQIVAQFGKDKLKSRTIVGFLDDFQAFSDEHPVVKVVVKQLNESGFLSKMVDLSTQDDQWKIIVADIIYKVSEQHGLQKNLVSDVLHKIALGIGLVNGAFDWNKEFNYKSANTAQPSSNPKPSLQPSYDSTSKGSNSPHYRRRKVLSKLLLILTIVGMTIFFVTKPKVEINSSKKLEVVLSPLGGEMTYDVKSNKESLTLTFSEPWMNGSIVGNVLRTCCEKNNTGKERINVVSVNARKRHSELIVRQMPFVTYFSLDSIISIGKTKDDTLINLLTDAFSIEANCLSDWCKIIVDGQKRLLVQREENSDKYARECAAEIVADTIRRSFIIRQKGVSDNRTEKQANLEYFKEWYHGEWKDGLPNGNGSIKYDNGNSYSGSFKDGEPHGSGTFTYANGDVYKGEFSNGSIHRQGEAQIKRLANFVNVERIGFVAANGFEINNSHYDLLDAEKLYA